MKFKIQILLCIANTPPTALVENGIYDWVDVPLPKDKKPFDTYIEASQWINDIRCHTSQKNDYKIVEIKGIDNEHA